jgi:hypothetical protein
MRKFLFSLPVLIFMAAFHLAVSQPALADDDPPGRVARLNYIQGSISFQPGGETEWVQASPNRPLTTGDNLWADRDSRGELHIGSTSIRVNGETGITFLNLDDRTVQIQLAQGSLSVTVRRLDGGDDFEIDTPNLAFTLQRPGNYRVDVDPNGNTTYITVRSGEGDATGGGSDFHMDSGDRGSFTGTDSLTYDGDRAGRMDDFDSWARSRDDREERSQSSRYVSRDVIGYDDLDDNGEWRDVPDYGHVWFPTHVAAGWAPYRYGHWAFIAPWGWTWVEDEPWGFAPFHYGRWAEVGGGWCWVPGPVVVRPVYAPALVVFVGGPRFGTSVSFGGGGGVAWFPLGPREVYVPPYRVSQRYVQNVNVTNTTVNVVNVTNVYNNVNVRNVTYVNQNNVRAVTAVSHDTFVNARPVAGANVRVNPEQMRAAEVQRNFAVAPVQRSVVGPAPVASARPPMAVMQRQVVVKTAPPPPRPSFNNVQQQPRTFRPANAPPQQPQQQMPSRPGQPQPGQQQQTFHPSQGQPGQPPMPPRGQQQPQQMQSQPPQQQQPQFHPPQGQMNQPPMPSRGQQQPQQMPPPPQQQQHGPQQMQSQPPQQQQQQPQFHGQPMPPQRQNQPPQPPRGQQEMRRPPEQQPPNVRYAPAPRANDDTYRPHQFERPQENARPAPQQQAAPPPQAAPQQTAPQRSEPPRQQQDRGQDNSRRQNDQKNNR